MVAPNLSKPCRYGADVPLILTRFLGSTSRRLLLAVTLILEHAERACPAIAEVLRAVVP
jgi:hypothetical protein